MFDGTVWILKAEPRAEAATASLSTCPPGRGVSSWPPGPELAR